MHEKQNTTPPSSFTFITVQIQYNAMQYNTYLLVDATCFPDRPKGRASDKIKIYDMTWLQRRQTWYIGHDDAQLTRDMVKRQPALASSPSPPRPVSLACTRRPPSRKQKITGSLWPATWLSICACRSFDGCVMVRFSGRQRGGEGRGGGRTQGRGLAAKLRNKQKLYA